MTAGAVPLVLLIVLALFLAASVIFFLETRVIRPAMEADRLSEIATRAPRRPERRFDVVRDERISFAQKTRRGW